MDHEHAGAAGIDRRELLRTTALGLTAALAAGGAAAQEPARATPVRAESNNYGGSVRGLDETKRRLSDALADRDLPAYLYNDLKRGHLNRTGSALVMDMYEHSYHMDFGAAAAQYVDALFNNVNWETVLARIEAL